MGDFAYQQERMVREFVAARGIRDPRVLYALKKVPRHLFVRRHLAAQAYSDYALPIGASQTISQPYVVARMTELLQPEADHSVLEIGTGSGYQTAILALLSRRVFSIERVAELAHDAIQRLRELSFDNVKIQVFDGSVGWSDWAPFDRILVTAATRRVPEPLLAQLAVGGRLLVPEGELECQTLVTYEKGKRGTRRSEGESVTFVPLVGRYGFQLAT